MLSAIWKVILRTVFEYQSKKWRSLDELFSLTLTQRPKSHLTFIWIIALQSTLLTASAKNALWPTFVSHHSDWVTVRPTDFSCGLEMSANTSETHTQFVNLISLLFYTTLSSCSWCVWGWCVCSSHHMQRWELEHISVGQTPLSSISYPRSDKLCACNSF